MSVRINWRGGEVEKQALQVLSDALSEIGMRVEAESKRELHKGRGVLTGTLRRSIHAADPEYNFGDDNMAPAADSPERGEQNVVPQLIGNVLWVAVGSGMDYALDVHQGRGRFGGYHYITNGLDKVKPLVSQVIEKHRKKTGLR